MDEDVAQWSNENIQFQNWTLTTISKRVHAGKDRFLSGLNTSLPPMFLPQDQSSIRSERGKSRIFLIRRDDGSLGLGIAGGKEYNTPVIVLEPGNQGRSQGLRVGDVILSVNGTDFSNITHAEAVVVMQTAWNVIMVVQHQTDHTGFTNQPLHRTIDFFLHPSHNEKLGCEVDRDDSENLIVTKVETNSAACKSGLNIGDRIIEIDGIPVSSLTDNQIIALTKVKRIRLTISRVLRQNFNAQPFYTESKRVDVPSKNPIQPRREGRSIALPFGDYYKPQASYTNWTSSHLSYRGRQLYYVGYL